MTCEKVLLMTRETFLFCIWLTAALSTAHNIHHFSLPLKCSERLGAVIYNKYMQCIISECFICLGVVVFFLKYDEKIHQVVLTFKLRNFFSIVCSLHFSFSLLGAKDVVYGEIKEHLRRNEPLWATVSLLLEPHRPWADISLCHTHHSDTVISPHMLSSDTHKHTQALRMHPWSSSVFFTALLSLSPKHLNTSASFFFLHKKTLWYLLSLTLHFYDTSPWHLFLVWVRTLIIYFVFHRT